MKKAALALVAATSLTGCAQMQESPCAGPSSRHVTIHYGDSELRVTPPVQNVHKTGDFKLRLQPSRKHSDLVDYKEIKVTVKGKPGFEWIDEQTTTFNTSNTIIYCAPESPVDVDQYYEVTIEDVGTLDPRVVIRD